MPGKVKSWDGDNVPVSFQTWRLGITQLFSLGKSLHTPELTFITEYFANIYYAHICFHWDEWYWSQFSDLWMCTNYLSPKGSYDSTLRLSPIIHAVFNLRFIKMFEVNAGKFVLSRAVFKFRAKRVPFFPRFLAFVKTSSNSNMIVQEEGCKSGSNLVLWETSDP